MADGLMADGLMAGAHDTSAWRLIPLFSELGATQMAIDSWLLDQHAKGLQPSILRFYTWRSPTISLGYHQRQFPSHWNELSWQGQKIDLVRRPTGGRAVLHQGDLTYALITAAYKGDSRRETYQKLCQFLIDGWQNLGVPLSFGSAGRGYIKNPNCFGTATAADLVTADGYKLIGSAQVYRGSSVLQHGSIRLQPDRALLEQVFSKSAEFPAGARHFPVSYPMKAIVSALIDAAEDCYQAKLISRSLSPAEIQISTASFHASID